MNTKNIFAQDKPDISLIEITDLFKKYRFLILGIMTIFTVIAILYALNQPRFYKASILLTPARQSSQQMSGISALLAEGFSGGNSFGMTNVTGTDVAISVLQSRKFIEMYIQENNLMQIIFSSEWDEENKVWTGNELPTMFTAYDLIHGSMEITSHQNLITFTVTWADPKFAANLANKMIDRVNEHIRNEAIVESKSSIAFLGSELTKTNLSNSIAMLYRLIEQQTQNITLANVREQYAFKVIDPAVAPVFPSGPRRKLIAFIGLVFGTLVGTLTSLLVHFYKFNIKNKK